jgi:hypothetical protein
MWWMTFACAVSSEFVGPGIVDGEVTAEGPFVVSATHAVPAKGQGDAFQSHVGAIQAELDAMDAESGLVGYSLRGELGGDDNWTSTIWTSEEAMLAFVAGEAHSAAMGEGASLLDEGTFVHWEVGDASALPPSWDDIVGRLESVEPKYGRDEGL